MNFTENIYTVTEINTISRELLEDSFSSVLIEGEISNLTVHTSGHMYFTLKDENSAIDGVMYSGYRKKINFIPKRGVNIVVKGKISLFVKGGRYQIIAWTMNEKGTGSLERKFLELKEKLKKEGLFDEVKKKNIPAVPSFIGVVTSPTGAAIRDIINVIRRRFANVKLLLYPVRVQGDTAAVEISEGIITLNDLYPEMDVMIVGRGGGSLEDLWPFNEEIVARNIYKSDIPVISAVGHEIDYTISDFTADLRAPTPSAAAELVVSSKAELNKKLKNMSLIIFNSMKHVILFIKDRLSAVSESVPFKYPLRFLEQKEQEVDFVSSNLTTTLNHNMMLVAGKLENMYEKLIALSPMATLERGYSITYKEHSERIVKDTSKLEEGDCLKTILSKGFVKSKILEIGD